MLRTILLLTFLTSSYAFNSLISGFAGNVLVSGVNNGNLLEMKKGKANVPPQMRSQYKRQQEMQLQREQMIASTQPGEDNLPIFNLFVRTKRANLVSSVSGDHVDINFQVLNSNLCTKVVSLWILQG
jgi:hypothetical protein